MIKLFRLVAMVLVGAFLGALFIGEIILTYYHIYDHGFGEGERSTLAGAMIGVMLGLAGEAFWRWIDTPRIRFSAREMFVAFTLFAVAMGVGILLVVWAGASHPHS